jgi:hypothetical protein
MKAQTSTPRETTPPVAALTEGPAALHEKSAMASATSLDERIAERAYFLYLARHGEGGDALGDWLEAERQIGQEQSIHG